MRKKAHMLCIEPATLHIVLYNSRNEAVVADILRLNLQLVPAVHAARSALVRVFYLMGARMYASTNYSPLSAH